MRGLCPGGDEHHLSADYVLPDVVGWIPHALSVGHPPDVGVGEVVVAATSFVAPAGTAVAAYLISSYPQENPYPDT